MNRRFYRTTKGEVLLKGEYLEAKRLSESIAEELGPPRFYLEKRKEVDASRLIFESHPMILSALEIVRERADRFGHGLEHVRKVAVDAGALMLIESEISGREELERKVLLAHIAGVLHDIKREEPDHARRGAEEAEILLEGFELEGFERRAVVQAIRNHEAFKPTEPLDEPSLQLLSDALYDADKFRWGPDNFTETVWRMVAPMNVPLSALMDHFQPSMDGIDRIKDTFRTLTGREYGPDFIGLGLEIGNRLYAELSRSIGGNEEDVRQH